MGEHSSIEWCDHTASPWYGCSKVHTGCMHCYAETMSKRNPQTLGVWGQDGRRVKSKSFIDTLRRFNQIGEREQRVQSVFPSLCDPFEDRPELEPWRREMFEAVDQLPWIRMLLLTKRPENIRRMWPAVHCPFCDSAPCDRLDECSSYTARCYWAGQQAAGRHQDYRSNVWLGTSISDQETADRMVPELLRCRELCPVLFVSCEPLLDEIDLTTAWHGETALDAECWGKCGWCDQGLHPLHNCQRNRQSDRAVERGSSGIDWVIVGGESGHGARPMPIDAARSLRDQCDEAHVPFFFKQMGGRGARRIWDPIPDDLQIRQFPRVEVPA